MIKPLDWHILDPRASGMLGFIPAFVSEDDPRPAKEQFHENYHFGGGWTPLDGWRVENAEKHLIKYPGDPAMFPIARAVLREETICVYPHAWVGIFQKDGSFEVARMD